MAYNTGFNINAMIKNSASAGLILDDRRSKLLPETVEKLLFLTLEALYIRDWKPTINTKDEYRSRELTIKV